MGERAARAAALALEYLRSVVLELWLGVAIFLTLALTDVLTRVGSPALTDFLQPVQQLRWPILTLLFVVAQAVGWKKMRDQRATPERPFVAPGLSLLRQVPKDSNSKLDRPYVLLVQIAARPFEPGAAVKVTTTELVYQDDSQVFWSDLPLQPVEQEWGYDHVYSLSPTELILRPDPAFTGGRITLELQSDVPIKVLRLDLVPGPDAAAIFSIHHPPW